MSEEVRRAKVGDLINKLRSFGCEVFLGGSRRFGWSTDESDWDLFVLVAQDDLGPSDWRDIVDKIEGFDLVFDGDPYDARLAGQVRYLNLAHVTFFQDAGAFYELQREHSAVENYLAEDEDMRARLVEEKRRDSQMSPGIYVYRLAVAKMKQIRGEMNQMDDLMLIGKTKDGVPWREV